MLCIPAPIPYSFSLLFPTPPHPPPRWQSSHTGSPSTSASNFPTYLPHKSLTRVQAGAPKASTTTGACLLSWWFNSRRPPRLPLPAPRPGRDLAAAHRRALRIRPKGSRRAPFLHRQSRGPPRRSASPPGSDSLSRTPREKGPQRPRPSPLPAGHARPAPEGGGGRKGKEEGRVQSPVRVPALPALARGLGGPLRSPHLLSSKMAAELPPALRPPRPRRAGRWHQLVPLRSSPPPAEASHLPVWGAAGPAFRPGFSRLRPLPSGGGCGQGEERALPPASARGPGAAAPPSCALRSPAAPPRSGPHGWRRCRCRSGRGGYRSRGLSAARLPLWAAKRRGGGPGPAGGSAVLPGRAGFSIAHKMARVPNLRSARRRQRQGPASPRRGGGGGGLSPG